MLECTTPGTTGVTDIDFSGAAVGTTYTDGTVTWTVIKASTTAELDEHKSSATAHANLLAGTNFGTAVLNHLLGSTLASLVDAVSTDSLFSKLLKKALEAAGLQYNIGSNGYICFGSLFGGLILKWGTTYIEGSTDSYGKSKVLILPLTASIFAAFATMGYPRNPEQATVRLEGHTLQIVGHNPTLGEQLVYCFWICH